MARSKNPGFGRVLRLGRDDDGVVEGASGNLIIRLLLPSQDIDSAARHSSSIGLSSLTTFLKQSL